MSKAKSKYTDPKLIARAFLGLLNGEFLTSGNVVTKLPFVFFLTLLVIVYIGNTHYSEKTIREADKLNRELKELRSEYITLRFDLMFKSRQSEIAKNVAVLGLKEPVTPPRKITLKEI
jgi:hypothetical protein